MTKRELILKEIGELDDPILEKIFEYAQFLRFRAPQKSDFFTTENSLEALALKQGVDKIKDFDQLLGDFWPEEETSDEFISALRQWRQEETVGSDS